MELLKKYKDREFFLGEVLKIYGRAKGNGQVIQVSLGILDKKNKISRKINRNLIGKVFLGDYVLLKNLNKEDKIIKKNNENKKKYL